MLLFGLPLMFVRSMDTVSLVLLDTDDAVAGLRAAGLNPEPIQEK